MLLKPMIMVKSIGDSYQNIIGKINSHVSHVNYYRITWYCKKTCVTTIKFRNERFHFT